MAARSCPMSYMTGYRLAEDFFLLGVWERVESGRLSGVDAWGVVVYRGGSIRMCFCGLLDWEVETIVWTV